MKGLADMVENDYHQTTCTEQLQKRPDRLCSKEQNCGAGKQDAGWDQGDKRLEERDIHDASPGSIRCRLDFSTNACRASATVIMSVIGSIGDEMKPHFS